MKWKLAALLSAMLIQLHQPSADACGVKLTIKSSGPRKTVAHTSNPSNILLVGSHPRRLERDLEQAGHNVEVARTPQDAKRKSYALVVTDSSQQSAARETFATSKIVVQSGDVVADLRSVEQNVRRTPKATPVGPDLIARRDGRIPVARGPARDPQPRTLVRTSPDVPPPEQPKPVTPPPPRPEPPKPVVAPPKPVEQPSITDTNPKPVEETPKPTRPVAKARWSGSGELYFSVSSSHSGRVGVLDRAARWLTQHPTVNVTIEGYADPTGNSDANMALSQRRAEWARDYLVAHGIDSSRLEVTAFGDTKLKYGRTDPRNRRVAIVAKTADATP